MSWLPHIVHIKPKRRGEPLHAKFDLGHLTVAFVGGFILCFTLFIYLLTR